MTQEEKDLLFKDLCGRLPYNVKISISSDYTNTLEIMTLNCHHLDSTYSMEYRMLRPYLRPIESMTEEEIEEWERFCFPSPFENNEGIIAAIFVKDIDAAFDWLNAHHFDYRGLIEKRLALEALEGMYNINKKTKNED